MTMYTDYAIWWLPVIYLCLMLAWHDRYGGGGDDEVK